MIKPNAIAIGLFLLDQVSGFDSFSQKLPYKTFNTTLNSAKVNQNRLATRDFKSDLSVVTDFVKSELGFENKKGYVISGNYTSFDGVKHYYLNQIIDNYEVFNGNIKINVLSDGTIQSFGDTFHRSNKRDHVNYAFKQNTTNMFNCLESALVKTNLTRLLADSSIRKGIKLDEKVISYSNSSDFINSLKASEGWLQLENNQLVPVWSLDVMAETNGFNAKVNRLDSKVVSLSNWKSEAKYRVYPVTISGPDGSKDRSFLENPQDKDASPLGWHDDGATKFTTTQGNNVISMYQADKFLDFSTFELVAPDPEYAESSDASLMFDFEFSDDPYSPPNPEDYRKASITNLFYVTNALHDLLYKYGFNELAGNFQQNNFGKGGIGNDPLIAYAQAEGVKDNSFIVIPPDGESPKMYMGLYGYINPGRDSSMDNSIIIHEYGHGLSKRLVCGPSNVDCITKGLGGGMGEGWSDTLAYILQMKPSYDRNVDMAIATYARDSPKGNRQYPYSTSFETNKLTYKDLATLDEVHAVGHLWATMLYEVYWNLVEKKPFTADWLGEGARNPTEYGNSLFLTYMMGGMSNLIADPNFIEARDALLKSEEALTKGAYNCEIWRGFAKRGMGLGARPISKEDIANPHLINSYSVPENCKKITELPPFYNEEVSAKNVS